MKHTLLFASALLAGAACAAIDANAAARAALTHAGLAAVASNALYVEPDLDDGRWVYEVKFHDGKTAYDYKLDANTGAVLKAERKALRQIPNVAAAPAAQPAAIAQPAAQPAAQQPGLPAGILAEAQAKSIALKDANVTEEAIRAFSYKAKLDTDDGVQVWEIEFRAGKMEYDYEIKADTGAILKREIEQARGLF